MKYRVSYTVLGKRMAYEYATLPDAAANHQDIEGFEGVTDTRTERIDSEEPVREGPFALEEATRFNRKDPV